MLPESKALDSGTRLLGLVLLVTWYITSAKAQAKVVKERFGNDYPRKGWLLPIGVAFGCIFVFFVLMVVALVIADL